MTHLKTQSQYLMNFRLNTLIVNSVSHVNNISYEFHFLEKLTVFSRNLDIHAKVQHEERARGSYLIRTEHSNLQSVIVGFNS